MREVTIREATLDDVFAFGPRMRAGDRAEMAALGLDREPEELVVDAYRLSKECFVAVTEHGIVALFGYRDIPHARIPWMLASDYVTDHAVSLVRFGRYFVESWASAMKPMINYVYCENKAAIEWLEAIGFNVTHDTIETETGAKFRRFEKVSHV